MGSGGSQNLFKLRPCDIAVSDADHSVTGGLQECGTSGIEALPIGRVVDVAFDLQYESFRGAIEVHDEAVQDMLAAELETEHPASA